MSTNYNMKVTGTTRAKAMAILLQDRRILEKHVRTAMRAAGVAARKEINKIITKGIDPRRAPLTAAMNNGKTRALGGTGEMRAAIKSKVTRWDTVNIGVARTHPLYGRIRLLHDGGTIPASSRMRGLFFVLWTASQAYKNGQPIPELNENAAALFDKFKDWKPLKTTTVAIKIPSRPFLRLAIESLELQARAENIYGLAVKHTIEEIERG